MGNEEKKAYLGSSQGSDFYYPLENLKKHFIALGSSGSGKTVLCKVLIEECAKKGIPAILVDPQGDLASLAYAGDENLLAQKGVKKEDIDFFRDNVEVTIFTPISSKGIPLCLSPLKISSATADEEELIPLMHSVATSVAKILGYDVDRDIGKSAEAVIYRVLRHFHRNGRQIQTFEELSEILKNMSGELRSDIASYIKDGKELELLIRKLKYMDVGEKKLLFQMGAPLDINMLLGKGQAGDGNQDSGKEYDIEEIEKGSSKKADAKKKTQVSIIYLNTLPDQSDKDFFVSILTTELYQWMLQNPKSELQCLYYIDEIAPFIPAGARKPIPKPILKLLFKQARKYGVGCIIATQNPGDIDYKAFAQFGTWAIGRLSVRQDQKKVEIALKSVSSADLSSRLAGIQPGNFLIYAPDVSKKLIDLQVRWLLTDHKTMTEDDVKDITDSQRDRYKRFLIGGVRKPKVAKEAVALALASDEKDIFFDTITPGEAMEIAEKNRARSGILGSKEDIIDIKTVYKPYILATVEVSEKRLFGLRKVSMEYKVFFDSITGDIARVQGDRWENISFSGLLGASPSARKVLSIVRENGQDPLEISKMSGMAPQAVSKGADELSKLGFASVERSGKKIIRVLCKEKLLSSVEKISSATPRMRHMGAATEDEKTRPKIDRKKLAKAVEEVFSGARIARERKALLTQYIVRYSQGKNKVRLLTINGYTGKAA